MPYTGNCGVYMVSLFESGIGAYFLNYWLHMMCVSYTSMYVCKREEEEKKIIKKQINKARHI